MGLVWVSAPPMGGAGPIQDICACSVLRDGVPHGWASRAFRFQDPKEVMLWSSALNGGASISCVQHICSMHHHG